MASWNTWKASSFGSRGRLGRDGMSDGTTGREVKRLRAARFFLLPGKLRDLTPSTILVDF